MSEPERQDIEGRRRWARERLAVLDGDDARYRLLFETIDDGFSLVECIVDDQGDVYDYVWLEVNAAFGALSGLTDVVGRRASELVPEGSTGNETSLTAALRTGETIRKEVDYTPDLDRWFRAHYARVGGDDSRIVAVRFEDITERKRAEEALRESEERQRLTIELVPALLWSASPDAHEITLNASWSIYTGQTEAETQGYGWLDAIHPEDLPATRAAFEHAFATGEPLEREQRICKAGDGYRWHLVRHVPVRNEQGAIARWFGAAVDVHDSKLAKQALDESERLLQTLVEGVPQLVWRAVDGGDWTWASPQWTAFTGQAEEDSHGRGWLAPVHPDDRERVKRVWAGAVARGEFHAEYRICHPADGRYRWFQTRATPVRNDKGEVIEWLGTSTDVEDLRGLQDRQRVLLHELQHRVRNTLAVVRSLSKSTAASSETVEDFTSHFEGRLNALARTQMVLTRSAGGAVNLDLLVREELLAQAARPQQVDVAGPEVFLSAKAAEVLALAVHELATNAIKYGALSTANGRVDVRWSTLDQEDQTWLMLHWSESGVRVVATAPRRRGFGSELIEMRVPYELAGRGALLLEPGGLHCEITFPLRAGDSILQTDAPAMDNEA